MRPFRGRLVDSGSGGLLGPRLLLPGVSIRERGRQVECRGDPTTYSGLQLGRKRAGFLKVHCGQHLLIGLKVVPETFGDSAGVVGSLPDQASHCIPVVAVCWRLPSRGLGAVPTLYLGELGDLISMVVEEAAQ